MRPPFSETELATEQAALEVAISMVEVISDIRHGAETVWTKGTALYGTLPERES
jgi:hypothetical protein